MEGRYVVRSSLKVTGGVHYTAEGPGLHREFDNEVDAHTLCRILNRMFDAGDALPIRPATDAAAPQPPDAMTPGYLFLDMDPERAARGERARHAKLNAKDIPKVRALAASRKQTLQQIADRYGVTRQTIWRIKERLSWRHV